MQPHVRCQIPPVIENLEKDDADAPKVVLIKRYLIRILYLYPGLTQKTCLQEMSKQNLSNKKYLTKRKHYDT
jgi:hypothetical protein